MIDTETFVPEESRWQDIFTFLSGKGYEVYPPGVKVGDCTSPYIVIKNDGAYKHANFSTDRDMYAIIVHVPKGEYSKLEPLILKLIQDMKEIEPMILPYGQRLPSYYDDTCKAHTQTVEYENYKKI